MLASGDVGDLQKGDSAVADEDDENSSLDEWDTGYRCILRRRGILHLPGGTTKTRGMARTTSAAKSERSVSRSESDVKLTLRRLGMFENRR